MCVRVRVRVRVCVRACVFTCRMGENPAVNELSVENWLYLDSVCSEMIIRG